MSYELASVQMLLSLEDQIRRLRRNGVKCSMVKTLDQQLSELRILVACIKRKYGIDLPADMENVLEFVDTTDLDNEEGLELIRRIINKFMRLDSYIDSLR